MGDLAPTDKVMQEQKTFPGHGSCLVQIYDTKGKKQTLVKIKAQGQDLQLFLDESNEEDITTQFKLKRSTKEFAKAVFDRLKIVMKDGNLMIEFNWEGIKRIQIEAAIRAEKLAETKRKNEEIRIQKEKEAEAAKLAEKKRLEEEEKKKKEEERRKKDAEELAKKKEEERLRMEGEKRKKAFEDKVMGAMMGGGVLKLEKKKVEEDVEQDIEGYTKTWSEECGSYFYQHNETFDITWRDPRIKSDWVKEWIKAEKQFVYKNMVTGETLQQEPWRATWEKHFIPDRGIFLYVNMDTGDSQEEEPAY